MDLTLSEEHAALRETVAQFAQAVVAPVAGQLYERAEFPYDLVRRMGAMGLFGLPIPEGLSYRRLFWPLTACAWNPAAAFAFKVIAGVEERFHYRLGTPHHAAYVMGFLCAASLKAGRTPPLGVPAAPYENAALDSFMAFLDEEQGQWWAEFARLTRDERGSLTPFVLDMAIVQASRRRDYNGMLELLSRAQDHGFSGAPLCRQATEWLNRIARCGAAAQSPLHAA